MRQHSLPATAIAALIGASVVYSAHLGAQQPAPTQSSVTVVRVKPDMAALEPARGDDDVEAAIEPGKQIGGLGDRNRLIDVREQHEASARRLQAVHERVRLAAVMRPQQPDARLPRLRPGHEFRRLIGTAVVGDDDLERQARLPQEVHHRGERACPDVRRFVVRGEDDGELRAISGRR